MIDLKVDVVITCAIIDVGVVNDDYDNYDDGGGDAEDYNNVVIVILKVALEVATYELWYPAVQALRDWAL